MDDPNAPDERAESYRWPYGHLALLHPRCPSCDSIPAAELVDSAIQPLYFCINEACPIWAWNPSVVHDGASDTPRRDGADESG